MPLKTDRIELRLETDILLGIDAEVERLHLDNRQAFIKIAVKEKLKKEPVKA